MASRERVSSPSSGCNLWLPILLALVIAVQSGNAIFCWECNSRYDRDCADPFRNATFDPTDCDMRTLEQRPGEKASVCRKIIQKVKDDYRFVRGCGWVDPDKENESHECFKRAGTFNVLVQYCSCNTEKCNEAQKSMINLWLLVAALVLGAMTGK